MTGKIVSIYLPKSEEDRACIAIETAPDTSIDFYVTVAAAREYRISDQVEVTFSPVAPTGEPK